MTISTHTYTAKLILDVGYEVVPGYDVTDYSYGFEDYSATPVAASQVYFQNFETGTTDGWALVSTGKLQNTLWGGSPLSQGQRSLTVGGNSVNATPVFQRAFTGLTVGRSYTYTAIGCALAPSGSVTTNATIGVVGIGATSTTVLTSTAITTLSYTFTATATSHTLQVSTWLGSSSTGDMATWDNITLTRNAYTDVINNGMNGWSNGSVVSTQKRSGTYSLSANAPARAFTGLVVGHQYTLEGWHSTDGTTWTKFSETFTAAATSQSRTLNVSGTRFWDDVKLIHHVPAVLGYDIPLHIKDGSISFDVSNYPHVQASLTVPVTDANQLVNFDPRRKLRVQIDANATFPTFSQSRTFNLSLRRARPNRATGDVELELASDEAVLQDYGPSADDTSPRQYAHSIRALTNYVLGKIGATLQAGTEDANVTPHWSAQNAILNPNAANSTGFTAAGGCTLIHSTAANAGVEGTTGLMVTQSDSASQGFMQVPQSVNTKRGDIWTFSAYGHRNNTQPALNGILRVYEINNAGTVLRQIESVPKTLPASGASLPYTWERFSLTFTIEHPETTKLYLYVSAVAAAAGRTVGWDGFMLTEGELLLDLFSGATAPAGYTTSWMGTAHSSVSNRVPTDGIERRPELFTWRAGQGGVDFLNPILQSQGFRLVCDENQKWTLRKDGFRAPGQLALTYGINIIDADEEISRDEDTWFDAAVYSYKWRDVQGIEKTKDDYYSAVGTPTKIVRRVIEREYPGPGRAQYAVMRAQNKGRSLTVESVSDWSVQADQELLVRLDGTPIQLGTTDRIDYSLSTDRMRVTARTADTPEGAIDLLSGTINALPGTINGLS